MQVNLIQIYRTLSIRSKINVILGSMNYVIDDAISVFKIFVKEFKRQ
jgi:hypothetical protein